MTNLWSQNGNRVAALAPGPGDLFVMTTVQGQRVAVHPIDQYEAALATAEAFARQMAHPRPFSIKVLCMSFAELLAHMGTTRAEFAKGLSPEDAEADRQIAIEGCMRALRECNEPSVRTSACEVLTSMGVLKQ